MNIEKSSVNPFWFDHQLKTEILISCFEQMCVVVSTSLCRRDRMFVSLCSQNRIGLELEAGRFPSHQITGQTKSSARIVFQRLCLRSRFEPFQSTAKELVFQ